MPDTMEAVRQDMDQEPADELGRGQPHDLLAVAGFDTVILPAKGNSLGVSADQARIRDSDAVGEAAEIGQHGFGARGISPPTSPPA